MKRFLKFLASVKLAVITVLMMAGGLAVGTFLESLYDTKTARFYVYGAIWFQLVLVVFGINIAAVAISRFPWKKKHTAFLLAHLGILILLLGSFLTQRRGLDAQMRITEGETSAAVELDEPILYLSERGKGADQVWSFPVHWAPEKKFFRPVDIRVPGWGGSLKTIDFLPYAEAKTAWVEDEKAGRPAVELKIEGGPMQISESFWLWLGDAQSAQSQMGPASFFLMDAKSGLHAKILDERPGPWVAIEVHDDRTLSFRAKNSQGQMSKGKLDVGSSIEAGFRAGVKLTLKSFKPYTRQEVTYNAPRFEEAKKGLQSALLLEISDPGVQPASRSDQDQKRAWVGLGDRVVLTAAGRTFDVAYVSRRVFLPFAVMLERFQIDTNPGTRDPSAYHSDVHVVDEAAGANPPRGSIRIQMNEPLHYKGFTFYQASYEAAQPRPVTSIFSVNQDPGRPFKYFGSLVLVAGIALLFIEKALMKKRTV